MYFLAVFSFGLSGDLAARQSIYPARMFTLPVTSAALAGWPMLYGTARHGGPLGGDAATRGMAFGLRCTGDLAGAAGRGAARLDAGSDVDAVRSARAAGDRHRALPGGDRGRRAAGAPFQGTRARDARHPGAAASSRVSRRPLRRRTRAPRRRPRLARTVRAGACGSAQMASRAANALPLACARSGLVRVAAARSDRSRRGSPSCCRSSCALLFVAGDAPALVFEILIGVLLTPPFMAAFVAATVRKSNPDARDSLRPDAVHRHAAADQRRRSSPPS